METQARVGVFLCNCGKKLAERIDFKALNESARGNPDVVFVAEAELLCHPEGLKLIGEQVKAKAADRLVIAACTPRLYEEKFAATAVQAGIDPSMVRVCNIREQCAWFAGDAASATDAARKALTAALGRSRLSTPVIREETLLNKRVLVIGGGIAGIQSAIEIVNFGYDVTLVEKSPELGGIVLRLDSFHQNGGKPRDFVGVRLENISHSERITTLLSTSVYSVSGFLGGFDVRLQTPEGRKTEKFGAIIVATGAESDFRKKVYGVDLGDEFVTQLMLEQIFADAGKAQTLLAGSGDGKRKRVFIIIGMGGEDSKLSSANMLKHALKLRREFDCEVYVAARHVKVAAPELERMYTHAREEGVVFFKFLDPSEVRLSADGGATVKILDPLLTDKDMNEYEVDVACDLVVLEENYAPDSAHEFLEHTLGIRPGPRGFYQEDNPHLLPVRTTKPGVFVVGSARQPMLVPEVLLDAGSVAGEVHQALSGGKVPAVKERLTVVKGKCVLCLNCKRVCPYDAITYGFAAVISETACQACGACAAVCPNMAIRYANETNEIYEIELESLV